MVGTARAGELALAIAGRLAHRGPDDHGTWTSPCNTAALSHRRLSILDTSAAARQPSVNEDGSVAVTYNGEIYNYQELLRDLKQRGHRLRSSSDTEVLVHLYEEHGDDLVHNLNGMFAFALFDAREQRLLVARDAYGIKPLYYAELAGGGLALASEFKALLRVPGIDTGLDPQAISDYLSFQFIADPHTPFCGIKRLPPGWLLTWEGGRMKLHRWWRGRPASRGQALAIGPREAARRVRAHLHQAVERQMVSDRPIGAFLSGGLDSSAVVAAMANCGVRPNCYTVRYLKEDNAQDPFAEDLPFAHRVARHVGADLHEVEVTADHCALWPEIVATLDEPIADPAALNAYLIAKRAQADGTVVLLTGQGADELFAGYRRHVAGHALCLLDHLPRGLGPLVETAAARLPGARAGAVGALLRRLRKLGEAASGSADERFLRLAMAQPPAALKRVLGPVLQKQIAGFHPLCDQLHLMAEIGDAAFVDRMLYRDFKTYLPAQNLHYTDRTTMAWGVEARIPYLDDDLVNLAMSLPASHKLGRGLRTKAVLKDAVAPWLPPAVISRSKTGFGVPLRAWLRGGLRDMIADALSPTAVKSRGLLDPNEVARQRQAFERGEADYAYPLFSYFTLELWCRAFVDRRSG